MNEWLPNLSTNKQIEYEKDNTFFMEGRKYDIITRENVVMHSELFHIDEKNKELEIHAEHKPLKSILKCSVIDLGNDKSKIVRAQSYPGLFGMIFNKFLGKRESGETLEYLNVWEEYAIDILKNNLN